MVAGNQSLLKKNNQRAIVDHILKNGAISRTDLAKALDVTKPTISSNISALMDESILVDVGFSQSYIGKKPLLFDFNKDYKFVLALDFLSLRTRNIVIVSVCNLFCEVIFTEELSLGVNYSAQTVSTTMPTHILDLLNANDVTMERIGAVVVSAPATILNTGVVKFECANHDIINLAKVISSTFTQNVVFENDINLAAIGENHFGVGKGVDNLFFIWAGLAVGGGLILNGNLHVGNNHCGGELAMVTLYNECIHKYDFFKDILSFTGIWNFIDSHKEEAQKSSIADKLFSDKLTIDILIEAAHNNDPFCQSLGIYIGSKIGLAITNLCITLDLDMVIVGGEYSYFGDCVINSIKEQVEAAQSIHPIITTPAFTNSVMYGAFKVGVDHIIDTLID